MSRREDYLHRRMDRKREAVSSKQARTARSLFIRMRARQAITALLAEFEGREEKVSILRAVLDMVGEMLWPLTNRVDAATAFNSVAADIFAPFKLTRAVASAEVDRLFSKMTPANDEARHE